MKRKTDVLCAALMFAMAGLIIIALITGDLGERDGLSIVVGCGLAIGGIYGGIRVLRDGVDYER